jgi:hypothetical protein
MIIMGMSQPNPLEQTKAGILQAISTILQRQQELDVDIFSKAVNTLAAAYSGLTQDDQADQREHTQSIEVMKMQQEQRLKQARLQMEQEKFQQELTIKQADLQLKKWQANQEEQRKQEMHQFEIQLKIDQQQHQKALNAATLSSKHEIEQNKIEQAKSEPGKDGSQK